MDSLTRLKSGIANWNQWRERNPRATCDLTNQDLSNGYFFEGNFRQVNFQGAKLRRACLIGADLREADLSHADLSGAYLGDANLQGADLSHANCEGIDLTGVDLQQTNLQGTRFSAGTPHRTQASAEVGQPQAAGYSKSQTATLEPPNLKQKSPPPGPRFGANFKLSRANWGLIVVGLALIAGLPLAFNQSDVAQSGAALDTPASDAVTQRSLNEEPQPDGQPVVEEAQPAAPFELTQSLDSASQVWAVTTYTPKEGNLLIISGGDDGLIEIRDRQTGEIVRTLTGHVDMVRSLAIANSGQWLVSSSGDGIKVWQPETGELIHDLPLEKNGGLAFMNSPIWSVAISPDEKTFISGNYDGHIMVWDLATGKRRYTFPTDSVVWSVAIAPNGQSFVTGSGDGSARQWNLASGELLQTFSGHRDAVRAVAISPDGRTLASGSWDSSIRLWDLATGEYRTTLNSHGDRVVSVAISLDSSTLASGSIDNTLRLWDLPSGTLTRNLDNSTDWVLTVDFALDEQVLVSGGKDRTIKVWQ